MTGQFLSESPERTLELAANLAAVAQAGDVVVLTGPLGAGKTHFAKGFARGLGLREWEEVTSPTYGLAAFHPGGRVTMAHLDLYRLPDRAAVESAGLEEYLGPPVVALIEWGERFPWLWKGFSGWQVALTPDETHEGQRHVVIERLGAGVAAS